MRTEVVRVGDEHLPALAEFIRRTWSPDATTESVRAGRLRASEHNPLGAGQDIPTFLFLVDGRAIGHLGTIPAALWCSGQQVSAHWMKGFMVLPEYQNGPVGFMLAKEAIKHLGCSLSLVVQSAPRRLFESMGFRSLGTLPNAVRIFDPAKVMGSIDLPALGLSNMPAYQSFGLRLGRHRLLGPITGGLLKAGMRTAAAVMNGVRDDFRVEIGGVVEPQQLEQLWLKMRKSLAATPFRDAEYLFHRYALDKTPNEYSYVTVYRGATLAAFAAVSLNSTDVDPRLGGIRIATVSELLVEAEDTSAGFAALASAESIAQDGGAHALLCSATHHSLQPLLRRRLFVRIPGTVHFLIRPDGMITEQLPTNLDAWWLMRGDSYADKS